MSPPKTPPALETLAELAGIFVGADDPLAMADRVLGRLAFCLGAEAVVLLGLAPVRVEASYGLGLPIFPAAIDEHSIVRRVLGEGASLTVPLATASEAWLLPWAAQGLRTVDARPLIGDLPRVLLVARRADAALAGDLSTTLTATCALWATAIRRRSKPAESRAGLGLRALADRFLDGGNEPPLRDLLRLLVDQACKLTRARYGALGVLNSAHSQLADFIAVGIEDEQARRIEHVPRGVGLLGAVVREGRTIRVPDLSKDPRSHGFPANHPVMKTFLGVPLRIGSEVFGNFYLTEKEGGAEFNEDDAALLESFAAQASLTVAYARETGRKQRLLDAVLHQAPHGILFVVAPGSILFSNAAARRMLGLSSEGPSEWNYRLLRPDGGPVPPEEYPSSRALAGETLENVEIQIVRATGDALPVFASAAPVRSETGRLLGAVVTLQDLTPFKELERLREDFSAVVAHDLRSPLNAIMMQIEVLLRTVERGVVHAPVSSIERMRRSGHTLEHLIRDLLDAARIESGRIQLDARPLRLDELARHLVQQLAPTLGGDRTVSVQVHGRPQPVLADPLRIEQVLTNLVDNAVKYSADKSAIEVSVVAQDDGVTVSVRDHGPGIAPEDLPRLFERYYRAGRGPGGRSGLGLGLFIAKGLVDAHGGRLWVESQMGEGSTFSLWLPRASR